MRARWKGGRQGARARARARVRVRVRVNVRVRVRVSESTVRRRGEQCKPVKGLTLWMLERKSAATLALL